MTQLTDAMNAAIATLQAQHGVTTDQVNSIVSQAVTPLQTSITNILSSEQSDEAKLADVETALTEFTTAFAPASTPAPVATPSPAPAAPEPSSVAPDSPATPAPATDSAPATPAPSAAS
jgi:hypothetical protein